MTEGFYLVTYNYQSNKTVFFNLKRIFMLYLHRHTQTFPYVPNGYN